MYPILLFDGDCAFCTASVNFLKRYIRPRAQITAWQRADLAELAVSEQECRSRSSGLPSQVRPVTEGRAVAAALRTGATPWPLVGRTMQLPGIVNLANVAYRLVAANRFRLPARPVQTSRPQQRSSGSGIVVALPADFAIEAPPLKGRCSSNTIGVTWPSCIGECHLRVVAPLMPRGTRPDTFDGDTFVALVPLNCGVRTTLEARLFPTSATSLGQRAFVFSG